MKNIKILISLLFMTTLLFGQKQKDFLELKSRYGFKVQRLPQLSFNVFINYNPHNWQPAFFIATAVQNDFLQFKHNKNIYLAQYQIEAAVRNKTRTLYNGSWSEEVKLKDFRATNSRRHLQEKLYHPKDIKFSHNSSSAGQKYLCLFDIRDLTSRHSRNLKQEFTVIPPPAPDSVQFSQISFLKNNPDSSGRFSPVPWRNILRFNRPYFAWLLLHLPAQPKARVWMTLQKVDNKGYHLIQERKTEFPADSGFVRIIYPLPYKILEEGKYLLRFKMQNKEVRRSFKIIWFEKPVYLYKTDLALRPLKYLLSVQQYDSVNSLNSEELDKWFKHFWKEKDRTPGTDFNELENEFYQRVDFANSRFSTRYKEGWETDRGKIYLLYGEPKKIENRRYATDTLPYLVWIYNDNLQFIFVDKAKNGEFYLINNGKKE